ncbi:hypothetical protein [Deinococcus ruber]|uniref:Uncharacterized protein n=1 Tax=Deinococcus ruber TaxID=1848197 RepID=A0A918CIB9_9DEIO|nr:hypothetical protein [Deinococcus ruber]GGR22586.1 hypothetical protein GCM10008957_38270 [Deinococcus ruber]
MSDSLTPVPPAKVPERASGQYTPPTVTVIGQWQAVTLLISTPLGYLPGNDLMYGQGQ